MRLYEMALTLAGDDLERCELLLALGDAQARAGDTPASQQAFREAAELAERLGLPEHLARAALGYGGQVHLGGLAGRRRSPAAARAGPRRDRGGGQPATRVRLLARLAGGPLRDASFPPERRRSLSEEALEMARRIGDPGTLAYALSGYIAAHQSPRHTPSR